MLFFGFPSIIEEVTKFIHEEIHKMEEMMEEKVEEKAAEKAEEKAGTLEAATMEDLSEELEASYKAAEEEGATDIQEMDPVWATLKEYLKEKTVLNVKIGGVVNAGVIAYVENIRGFIPASRLSLEHVEDLNEWLHKKIRVRVITAEPKKKRLVLSAREILRDEARAKAAEERKTAMEHTKVGDVLDGTVETLKEYGAFIRLENGLSGLVHVSQISDKRVTSPDKVLKEGENVKVKVIAIKDGKLSLSMKALLEKAAEETESSRDYKLPKSENISTNLGSLLANLKL